MAVKTYSLKKDGGKKLAESFVVKEFACTDGSDTILIDTKLVTYLQQIHDQFKKAVIITSGYRTPAFNQKITGSKNSYHVKGQAADFYIKGVNPKEIAKFAEGMGIKGIGLYTTQKFVHIDTRTKKYFWLNDGNNAVSTHGYVKPKPKNPYATPTWNLKKGSKGNGVRWLQWELNESGASLVIDGDFGVKTDAAVRAFQKKYKLVVDGIVGTLTRSKLKAV